MKNEEMNVMIENEEGTIEVKEANLWTKTKRTVKKHGKKIAIGAGIVAGVLIARAVGKRAATNAIEPELEEIDENEVLEEVEVDE